MLAPKKRQFRIAALFESTGLQSAYGGDFALLDIAAAQEAFDQVDSLSRIDLLVDESNIDAVRDFLRSVIPLDATIQRPAQRGQEVAAMLSAFRLNLGALSCIAIFVGAFLIYNAIASAVVRRRAEIGVLRSIGASRKQLRAMFLVEAGVLGLFGSVVGLALG